MGTAKVVKIKKQKKVIIEKEDQFVIDNLKKFVLALMPLSRYNLDANTSVSEVISRSEDYARETFKRIEKVRAAAYDNFVRDSQ